MAYKSKYTGQQVDDGLDLAYRVETLISEEAENRETSDTEMRAAIKANMDSIDRIGGRVTTTENQILGLQSNVGNLQTEVNNIKTEVIPTEIAKIVAEAPEDLDTLKEVADYIASDKTKAAQIETAISNLQKADAQLTNSINANATNIAKNASDITANTEELAKQAKELENKAPKVGYAPDLKVDFAKELVGRGVAEPQEIGTIRPTGLISIGDGNPTIEKVNGKSVVWNQLSNVSGYKKYMEANKNIELSISDGILNVTNIAYEGTGGDVVMVFCYTEEQNEGDKILAKLKFRSSNPSLVPQIEFSANVTPIPHSGVIYSATKKQKNLHLKPKGTKSIGDTWSFSDIEVVNLTKMFGAGNEPTTVEEYEARKPLGVTDEYNDGEIISYDAQALKSVGFNAFNGTYARVIGGQQYHALGTITSIGFTTELGGETTDVTLDSEGMFTPSEDGYIYAEGTDICIHLTHTYTPEHTTEYEEDTLRLPDVKAIKDKDGNQLFPYGLLSAGSVHDEITATKAVKRVGSYVLDGSKKWTSYNGLFRLANPPIDCRRSSYALTSSRYTPYKSTPHPWNTFKDKHILIYNADVKMFIAWDSTYSTVEEFEESLKTSPITVHYELAEPIEVDLPEPLNLTYDAWDFGTEELVAEGKTTPLNADIVYQFNAVDRIRENTAKNQALGKELAELKAQLTQLTQATNDEDSNT